MGMEGCGLLDDVGYEAYGMGFIINVNYSMSVNYG
jgi:hypothetical protein